MGAMLDLFCDMLLWCEDRVVTIRKFLIKKLRDWKIVSIRQGIGCHGFVLGIGDEVIVIPRDDHTGFLLGTYLGHDTGHTNLPIIKYLNGAEKVCGAIVRPYSYELFSNLARLSPTEQWNYLAHDHIQLEEEGRGWMFKCTCGSCKAQGVAM